MLDGFFALHAGNKTRALAAARRVNIKQNDDIEDLYLAHMAFAFGGDTKTAAKVKEKIKTISYVSHAVPIMSMWLSREEKATKNDTGWSPRYPTGKL